MFSHAPRYPSPSALVGRKPVQDASKLQIGLHITTPVTPEVRTQAARMFEQPLVAIESFVQRACIVPKELALKSAYAIGVTDHGRPRA